MVKLHGLTKNFARFDATAANRSSAEFSGRDCEHRVFTPRSIVWISQTIH